jgi:endoglucanase
VTVSGIAVSQSEFTTSNLSLPLVLLAGQSVDLSVSFTPTAWGWTGAAIKFSSDASNAALRLEVAGTGVSSEAVTANPSTVSFGQVAIGTVSTVPVVLTNARSWKVTLSALQTTGGGFSTSGPSFPLTLGAGQSVTENVAFAPQSAGTTGGKLFISGPGLAIPLNGTGTAPGHLTVVAPPIGINVSQAEYSWGSFARASDLAYLRSNNISLIRLPIAWEKAQPVLLGPLDPTYLSAMTTFISTAGTQGMQVIVDVHDYGRYNVNWAKDVAANGVASPGTGGDEEIIGSVAVPISAFADFWTKLAGALKGTPGLGYYDIMNEPYNMGDATVWPTSAQSAVNAIRAVDMNTQILVEGTQWASAYWWPRDNGSLNINDPANKLLYEAHLYFDSDGSGRYLLSYAGQGAYPNWGVDHLQPFLAWLKRHNAKGFLGEFGVPNTDPQWLAVLDNFLTALQAAGLSGTYWNYTFHSLSDPSWWPVKDPMSIIDNGPANPQMGILVKHNTQFPQ